MPRTFFSEVPLFGNCEAVKGTGLSSMVWCNCSTHAQAQEFYPPLLLHHQGTVKREDAADSVLVLLCKSLWPHGPVCIWVSSGTECWFALLNLRFPWGWAEVVPEGALAQWVLTGSCCVTADLEQQPFVSQCRGSHSFPRNAGYHFPLLLCCGKF